MMKLGKAETENIYFKDSAICIHGEVHPLSEKSASRQRCKTASQPQYQEGQVVLGKVKESFAKNCLAIIQSQ
jgi:hypothetical protein